MNPFSSQKWPLVVRATQYKTRCEDVTQGQRTPTGCPDPSLFPTTTPLRSYLEYSLCFLSQYGPYFYSHPYLRHLCALRGWYVLTSPGDDEASLTILTQPFPCPTLHLSPMLRRLLWYVSRFPVLQTLLNTYVQQLAARGCRQMGCLYAVPTGSSDTVRCLFCYRPRAMIDMPVTVRRCRQHKRNNNPVDTTRRLLARVDASHRLPHLRPYSRPFCLDGEFVHSNRRCCGHQRRRRGKGGWLCDCRNSSGIGERGGCRSVIPGKAIRAMGARRYHSESRESAEATIRIVPKSASSRSDRGGGCERSGT